MFAYENVTKKHWRCELKERFGNKEFKQAFVSIWFAYEDVYFKSSGDVNEKNDS